MSVLHIVNKSPFERNSFASCLRMAKDGAALLLIEDGIYAAQNAGDNAADLEGALSRLKVYALGPDVTARGLNDKIDSNITLVDYDGFVQLVTEHDKVQSWL